MAGPAFFVRSCLLTNVVVAGAIVALFLARQQKMQKLIEQAKKEWEETFDIINDAITIHDRDFKIIRANKAASLMLGLPFSVLLQRKCYQCYHGSNYPPQSCPSCKTLTSGKPTVAEVFDDSLNKYLEIKSLPRLDGENRITGVVHVARDITERVNAENRLRTLTLTDDLTGLYNRRGFMAFAEQQQKIALRMNRGYFILFADLDRLKEINDRFGHQEGSDALVRTAAVLRDCFRESDVMARIGGDEFAVYFMENDEASAATASPSAWASPTARPAAPAPSPMS